MKNLDYLTIAPKLVLPLMEPGDKLTYPIKKMLCVRVTLCELRKKGLEGEYITRVNKEKTALTVYRLA